MTEQAGCPVFISTPAYSGSLFKVRGGSEDRWSSGAQTDYAVRCPPLTFEVVPAGGWLGTSKVFSPGMHLV